MLQAIAAGAAKKAEKMAREHIWQAADFMVARLREAAASTDAELPTAQGEGLRRRAAQR